MARSRLGTGALVSGPSAVRPDLLEISLAPAFVCPCGLLREIRPASDIERPIRNVCKDATATA